MTEWKITAYFYVEAENESAAWSSANLMLMENSQITEIKEFKND